MGRITKLSIFMILSLSLFLGTGWIFSYSSDNKEVKEVEEVTITRGVIDVGSGSIKLTVAEIKPVQREIVEKKYSIQIPISMQNHLKRAGDSTFDMYAQDELLATIQLLKAIAYREGAEQVVAVATAAFRQASNNEDLKIQIYNRTSVPLYILPQEEEGRLGFEAALLQAEEDKIIVWDIGGGSMQIITKEDGNTLLYKGKMAAVSYKNMLLELLNKEETPNPLTIPEIETAVALAQDEASKVSPALREQIKKLPVYGIGSIHNFSVAPRLPSTQDYTIEGLRQYITENHQKYDEEFGTSPFRSMFVTNALLVLGFMQELEIPAVNPINVTLSDGVFVTNKYWEE